jgi:hypothetical protein
MLISVVIICLPSLKLFFSSVFYILVFLICAVGDLIVSLVSLQIKFCGCPGRSSWSSLHNFNNSGVSMTCKDCCGESTSGKGGSSCSNKLNSMALELPRPIDLGVRWKNVNRRKRATRRARTKFFGEDRMRDDLRSFYAFGNAMNRERSQEDAPVSSESEQVLTFFC